MTNQILKLTGVILSALLSITIISCDKDDNLNSDSVENYVDEVVFDMQERGNCGRFGCYEFIFPVTIDFPDGTSLQVENYEALRDALKAYREANPDANEHPSLAFPIELLDEDGELITVVSKEELDTLRLQCRKSFFGRHGPKGHRFRGAGFCFKLVFPINLEFPDATTEDVTDRRALKTAVRTWKSENPDAEERPMLSFPITVQMEDGTEVEVADKEALQTLKESCGQ